jgi:hypothetical protein
VENRRLAAAQPRPGPIPFLPKEPNTGRWQSTVTPCCCHSASCCSYGEGNAAAILSRASPEPCENGSKSTGASRAGAAQDKQGGGRAARPRRLGCHPRRSAERSGSTVHPRGGLTHRARRGPACRWGETGRPGLLTCSAVPARRQPLNAHGGGGSRWAWTSEEGLTAW